MTMTPYVRVKRRNQTVFVDVQLHDTFLSVKEKLATLFHLTPQQIQLWQNPQPVRTSNVLFLSLAHPH